MTTEFTPGTVIAVCSDSRHAFSKHPRPEIQLLAGEGVAGDAHVGTTVQHLSRVARDPSQPNLRQVHLLHEELLAELVGAGFEVGPGSLGENITTRGIDLLALGAGTRLCLPSGASIEITGLRNPCRQIERFRTGLLKSVLRRSETGELIRKAGVMGIVTTGGPVRPGDHVLIAPAAGTHQPLAVV